MAELREPAEYICCKCDPTEKPRSFESSTHKKADRLRRTAPVGSSAK
jgi:hypothetical protein